MNISLLPAAWLRLPKMSRVSGEKDTHSHNKYLAFNKC